MILYISFCSLGYCCPDFRIKKKGFVVILLFSLFQFEFFAFVFCCYADVFVLFLILGFFVSCSCLMYISVV